MKDKNHTLSISTKFSQKPIIILQALNLFKNSIEKYTKAKTFSYVTDGGNFATIIF